MTDGEVARRLAAEASQALEPIYQHLGAIAAEIRRCRLSRAAMSEAHFTGLQRMVSDLLATERGAWGMGFVAAPGVVDGLERYMAWWQRYNDRVTRLRLNFDPTSVDVYDYLQMDWYQLALRGQGRVAYGPYVDYSGSDLYTITATIPIFAEGGTGEFLGVAGADLEVGEVEHRLLGVLRQTADDAVIVSTDRRVIAANTPRWFVGSRLAAMPAVGADSGSSGFREVAEMPLGTGWVLAIADPGAGHPPTD